MKTNTNGYRGYRFPPEIISHGVWLYHGFCLSFRDVEELLAKRGIFVTYETIRQWCRKFGQTVLSQAAEGTGKHTVAAGDGQVEKLLRSAARSDVICAPRHRAIREQPR